MAILSRPSRTALFLTRHLAISVPRLPWRIGLAIWVAITVLYTVSFGLYYLTTPTSRPESFGELVWSSGGMWLLSGAMATPSLRTFQRLGRDVTTASGVVFAFLAGWFVLHAGVQAGTLLTDALIATVAPEWLEPDYSPILTVAGLGGRRLGPSIMTFVGIVSFDLGRRAMVTMIAAERRSADLAAALSHARLDALRHQLHPHFLFNTLNAISCAMRDDPRLAETMLERLADLLRAALDDSQGGLVALDKELALVEAYLAIQGVRFGERLRVVRDLDPRADHQMVPVLLLQPLVENAIRHGVEAQRRGGVIGVTTRWHSDRLVITISDDGPGPARSGPASDRGLGLRNTRARLGTLYGEGARLVLHHDPDAGRTTATIEIPTTTVPHAQEDS